MPVIRESRLTILRAYPFNFQGGRKQQGPRLEAISNANENPNSMMATGGILRTKMRIQALLALRKRPHGPLAGARPGTKV